MRNRDSVCTDVHVHERASSFSEHASVFGGTCARAHARARARAWARMCGAVGWCVFVVRLEVPARVGGAHIYATMTEWRTTTLTRAGWKTGVTERRLSHTRSRSAPANGAHVISTNRKKSEIRGKRVGEGWVEKGGWKRHLIRDNFAIAHLPSICPGGGGVES